jgi:sulfite exporter TauE/SafE
MSAGLLASAWLIGTLGSVHCLAMCGGFVAATAARDAAQGSASVPLRPAATIIWRQLACHAGRVLCYSALGAVFGAAGAAALDAAALLPLQRVLFVAANALLLLLGVSFALGRPGIGGLQRAGAKMFAAVLPVARPLLAMPGALGGVALGVVWGLVPCALVYSTLPLALFAGGAWQGALLMLAFGAGTVPTLVTTAFVFRFPRRLLGPLRWRYTAAIVLIAFGAIGIYRIVFVPGALAQGAFCLPG